MRSGPISAYLLANVITIVGLVAAFQVPLVTDVIASLPYSQSEVFVGIFSVLEIFYTVLLGLSIK